MGSKALLWCRTQKCEEIFAGKMAASGDRVSQHLVFDGGILSSGEEASIFNFRKPSKAACTIETYVRKKNCLFCV